MNKLLSKAVACKNAFKNWYKGCYNIASKSDCLHAFCCGFEAGMSHESDRIKYGIQQTIKEMEARNVLG
jgi:hypothetical protein